MKRSVWMAASAAVALSVIPVGAAAADSDTAQTTEQAASQAGEAKPSPHGPSAHYARPRRSQP